LSPGLNLLLNFLFNSDLFPFNISVEKIKQSNNKKSKRDICLQIQVLKFKCRQSVGHWKFRLNFILEFGAEFSVEYLIPCVFFLCVCLVVFFVFVFFVEYPYVFCPFVFSLLFYYTLISDIWKLKTSFFQNLLGKLKSFFFPGYLLLLLVNNIKKKPSKIISSKRIHWEI
jgi:hypothetical protein